MRRRESTSISRLNIKSNRWNSCKHNEIHYKWFSVTIVSKMPKATGRPIPGPKIEFKKQNNQSGLTPVEVKWRKSRSSLQATILRDLVYVLRRGN